MACLVFNRMVEYCTFNRQVEPYPQEGRIATAARMCCAAPRERWGGAAGRAIPNHMDTRRPEMHLMPKHKTGTRQEWLAARLELLESEKDLTRRSDELARRRQELPWVRVDREYRFETDEGRASLA